MRVIRFLVAAMALFAALPAPAQVSYAGKLGGQPIQLVLYEYSDGVVIAAYAYDQYDTPIRVNGKVANGELALQEKDAASRDVATLRFAKYGAEGDVLRGEWRAADGTKTLPIVLRAQFEVGPQEGPDDPELQLLQAASSTDHYFKVVLGGTGRGDDRVHAVAVYRKGTDELVQRIDLDTQFRGIDSVQVGDFDFDGVEDFSLFESSYAGPNTSSLYFLRDAGTGQYVAADFAGTSLEFDAQSKLVYEHNQCCMGSAHENATYRVVGRKLELIEKKCWKADEDVEDLVEVPCSE